MTGSVLSTTSRLRFGMNLQDSHPFSQSMDISRVCHWIRNHHSQSRRCQLKSDLVARKLRTLQQGYTKAGRQPRRAWPRPRSSIQCRQTSIGGNQISVSGIEYRSPQSTGRLTGQARSWQIRIKAHLRSQNRLVTLLSLSFLIRSGSTLFSMPSFFAKHLRTPYQVRAIQTCHHSKWMEMQNIKSILFVQSSFYRRDSGIRSNRKAGTRILSGIQRQH